MGLIGTWSSGTLPSTLQAICLLALISCLTRYTMSNVTGIKGFMCSRKA